MPLANRMAAAELIEAGLIAPSSLRWLNTDRRPIERVDATDVDGEVGLNIID